MMVDRKFTVTNESGEKLVCIEVLPNNKPNQSFPVVVMCHGFAYFKEEDGIFTEMAKRLASLGYAAYYFDFSGCGESEGDYKDTSLTKLVADLHSVLQVISNFPYANMVELSLIGQSFGTNVCVAAEIKNLKRMVLCGAFGNSFELLSGLFPSFDEKRTVFRVRSDGRQTIIAPPFWADLKTYDLFKGISNLEFPILFIHGELDDIVPIERGKQLMSHAKDARMVVIKKSNHGLRPGRQQAIEAVANFFE